MKSCLSGLVHLLGAKCLSDLMAAPVAFMQSLLIWICYLMWARAVVLMVIAIVHAWQTEARCLLRKGAEV